MQECFAPDGVHSEDAPSALMKCPARAGREKRRKKKDRRTRTTVATVALPWGSEAAAR